MNLQGNILNTYSGGSIDYLNPESSVLTIHDIAIGLSREHRYGNQLKEDYTVLHHSLLCLEIADREGYDDQAMLSVLLHDASEAFVHDMPAQAKQFMPGYKKVEDRIQSYIESELGIPIQHTRSLIKSIDLQALITELGRFRPKELGGFRPVLEYQRIMDKLMEVSSKELIWMFLSIYRALKSRRC